MYYGNKHLLNLKFHIQMSKFWQIRNLRLPYHLFVCNIDDTGHTVRVINTKLTTYMCLASGRMCILFGVDDVLGDVIRCNNRSDFEIAIAQSIFELERRSKAQNVGHTPGFFLICSTSCDTSDEKFRSENFRNIQCSFNLTSDVKGSSQIILQKNFHGDDVIDDVTGRPQNFPSIFLYQQK